MEIIKFQFQISVHSSRATTCISTTKTYWLASGPGSSVGIATGYGLEGPGIESRWGARFSASVHTGPGAHPASCTICTGSFPGAGLSRG